MSSIDISATERITAAEAVRQAINELRDSGMTVEVIHDGEVIANVRVSGDEGDPVMMRIDPLNLWERLNKLRLN